MPGGNRTGPMGQGPMTGRGLGYCSGNTAPGFATAGFGRGFGFGGGGRGRGRGWRNWFGATGVPGWQRAAWGWPAFGAGWGAAATQTPAFTPPAMTGEQELEMLKQQAQSFAGALEQLNGRIAELEAQTQAK